MVPRPDHPSLDQAFASATAKRRYVRILFGTIARRYDLITRVLSYGADQRWKVRLIAEARIQPGSRVLDLACGTGDLALLAVAQGGQVIALDLAEPMIDLARQKPGARDIAWVAGDMCALPVASGTIDRVTTGYGLRNVPDLAGAIAEIHRVLRPGGVACALDFDRPQSAVVRIVYLTYLTIVGSTLGWVLHGNADTYRYIPASIRRYPGAAAVAELMRRAGFHHVRHVPLLGGLMALHVASKDGVMGVSYNEQNEGLMDVSELRKRILRGIDEARKETAVRRGIVDEARKAYEGFLARIAVPMFRQAALVLNAAVQPHEVHTPAETVRLVSEQSPHTYLEIELETSRAQPAVIGRVSLARGRQGQIVEERPIGTGSAIWELTEEDLSAFLVAEIPRLVVKF